MTFCYNVQASLAPLYTKGHSKTHVFQIQISFMKKNVMKLDNEPLDEEFEKLVQGFLADEKSSDDSDTDDEDTDEDGDADDEGGDNGVPNFAGERL